MKIVVKNRSYGRERDNKVQAYWTVIDEGEQKIQWNKIPYGNKGEAFKRISRRLDWNVVGYRQIKIVADINSQVYVILKGIQQDSNFENVWRQVEELDFREYLKKMYTYYASSMLG